MEQRGDGGRIADAHVLGRQHPSREHITHQIHSLVALVGLDAVDGQDQAAVGVDLVVPGGVGGDLVRCADQGAISIKQIQHLAP